MVEADLPAGVLGALVGGVLVTATVLAALGSKRRWLGGEAAVLLTLVALWWTDAAPGHRGVWAAAVDMQAAMGLLAWAFLTSVRFKPTEARAGATTLFTALTFGALAGAAVAVRTANPRLSARCVVIAVAAGALSPLGTPATLLWTDPLLQLVALGPACLAAVVVAWPGGTLMPDVPARFSPLLAVPVAWLIGPAMGAGLAVFLCGTSAVQGLPLLDQRRSGQMVRWTVWLTVLTTAAHLSGALYWAVQGLAALETSAPALLLPLSLLIGAVAEPGLAASLLHRMMDTHTMSDGTVALLFSGLAVHAAIPVALFLRRHGREHAAQLLPGLAVLYGLLLLGGL